MEAPGEKSVGTAGHGPVRENALEAGAGPLLGAGMAEEAGVVMEGEDQAVDLEEQLARICVVAQVALGHGGGDGALERELPGIDHVDEGVPNRAGPVVELDRAADVDA